ncbi:hypothetical protein FO488_08755 [Geobacter sp. FeAm09]|uniref:hypothetical protein n=1 Tax=Geobacter sp. FeAm09 TaxID=2597769 RepID=UPI0011EFB580|nr:hypothetical protein [Geobacter sp. FeAm09]QEM68244.1 hypothetical protein FO488_08755 [Geobacter sp. FeAm09]
MIDTIKLAYPLDRKLNLLLEQSAERLQKISPDGEILWEKSVVRGDCMPSHYSGLRITTRQAKDLLDLGFAVKDDTSSKDVAFFEFSLQKWQSPSAYNNKNTSLETDLLALHRWIHSLSIALGYDFTPERFAIYRVDLSQNFLMLNASPVDYLRVLELRLSKHPTSDERTERKGHMIALRSSWVGKKLYYKGQEFLDVERKKHKHLYSDKYCADDAQVDRCSELVPLSPSEIDDLMRMVRFELEFKRHYLTRYQMDKIKDIPKLVERFDNEKAKYIDIPILVKGEIRGVLALSAHENQIIELVRRFGLKEAKNQYTAHKSERSWYQHKRNLASRNIHLEALDNIEYRYTGLEIFHNPEQLKFQMQLAPFQEADEDRLAA